MTCCGTFTVFCFIFLICCCFFHLFCILHDLRVLAEFPVLARHCVQYISYCICTVVISLEYCSEAQTLCGGIATTYILKARGKDNHVLRRVCYVLMRSYGVDFRAGLSFRKPALLLDQATVM